MKVIFLDIDGVLNSVGSAIALRALRGTKSDREDTRLSPISVGLLKSACDITGAKVVISSTWRIGRSGTDFRRIFALYGWVDFPYAGRTGTSRVAERRRGAEIRDWLNANPCVEDYVILDDDSDMLKSQGGNFIHVSNVDGFRPGHYVRVLERLGHRDLQLERQVNFKRKSRFGD